MLAFCSRKREPKNSFFSTKDDLDRLDDVEEYQSLLPSLHRFRVNDKYFHVNKTSLVLQFKYTFITVAALGK